MQLNLFSYQNNIDSSDSYVPERVLLAFTDWTKTMAKRINLRFPYSN